MYAFSRCGNLTSITIPASVTKIGNNVFEGCSNLTSITIPYGVTVLYSYTFQFCTSLNAVTIPASVRDIHNCAFQGCTGLTSVTIPDGVTSIGSGTFADCTGLKTVTIPASVTSIDFDAFHNCPEVTDVYCYADPATLTWYEKDCDDFKDNKGTTCHVFDEAAWTTKFNGSVNLNFVGDLQKGKANDGNYWSTFYDGSLGYEIKAGTDACAYTATYSVENEIGTLTLHKLGRVIPKQTAVIIVSASENVGMSVSTESAEYTVSNHLHGLDNSAPLTSLGSGSFYVMGKKSDNFGFFQYTGTNMPAHKAYLRVDGGEAHTRGFSMVFDDEVSGIKTIPGVTTVSDSWYTLDGRQLARKPSRPGIYIHNGKRFAIR